MVVAVIPARGGSTGIYRKNVVVLKKKPLVQWSIEKALELGFRTIVNTDDQEIADLCSKLGAEVLLSDSAIHSNHAINPVLNTINRECISHDTPVFMFLPTSPFRKNSELLNSLKLLENYDSVIGVNESKPFHSLRRIRGDILVPLQKDLNLIAQRQEVEKLYYVTGSLFLARAGTLRKSKTYHVPNAAPIHCKFTIDINHYSDLELARHYARNL